MQALVGDARIYVAEIEGVDIGKLVPTEIELRLKVDAQVMMVKNGKAWVNGTLGIVRTMSDDTLSVEIGEITHTVDRAEWDKYKHYYDPATRRVRFEKVGVFRQFPVRLAWAITIHKSQGKTYSGTLIDLRDGAFATGQTYVALSRCTTLNGTHLLGPIGWSDIQVDPTVVEFMATVSNLPAQI